MGEWRKVRLGDCIKEINERTTENNQYQVLSVTKDGIFSQEEYFKKQIASENNIGYKILRRNNLVFSTMNLWMGSLDVLTNYDIGIVSPAYKIFEFNEELMLPEFGNYFMKSYYMLEKYKNCSEQGASIVRRNLDLKALLNVEITLPASIEEQMKIVKVLENIDKIIVKYNSLLEKKEQFIQTQFVKMFGNIPKKDKLKNVCYIKARIGWQRLNKEEYLNKGDYYLVTGVDIDNSTHKINYDKCYYVSKERYDKDSKIQLKNGDIILTKDGTIGKVAIIENLDKPATLNSHLFVIRDLTGNLSNIYFLNLFLSKIFTDFVNKNETGGTRKGLNQSIIENFMIPLPDLKQQEDFERIYNVTNRQKIELEKLINNYKNLRKGLMQKLLTGKVILNG